MHVKVHSPNVGQKCWWRCQTVTTKVTAGSRGGLFPAWAVFPLFSCKYQVDCKTTVFWSRHICFNLGFWVTAVTPSPIVFVQTLGDGDTKITDYVWRFIPSIIPVGTTDYNSYMTYRISQNLILYWMQKICNF